MTRRSDRLRTFLLLASGFAGLCAAAVPAAGQTAPTLAARYAGTGSYEIRGGGGTWELSDARVVLGDGGTVTIEVSGRKIQLAMRGKVTSYNGREHVNIALDTFDGKPTSASGWMEIDRRGGFSRLEIDGKTPVRLGISFQSKGSNLEPAPAPTPAPAPSGLTEEYGLNRRGADYRNFEADGLRTCQEACKGDTRCRAYAYNLNRRICYLKSQVTEATSDREVTSGVKQGWGGGEGGGGGGQANLTEERGLDRRGSDYSDFRARDLFDCQDSCRRDDRCRAYSFDTRDRSCWLKERVNSQQHNRDMVTGYKE
ncbi:MAG: PAN domain-containing protein [Thermoanaerobaculia bacterium]